jgi:uncharacterized membrane protein
MFVIAAVMWPRVPDRVPVHWGLSGQADRWGGKAEGLLLLPVVTLLAYGLLLLLPRIDPRREHYATFAGPYRALRTAIVGMFLMIQAFTVTRFEEPDAPFTNGLPALLGIVFIVLGNYLPKIQSNWFVGVRTPWTLSSEESWRRTHHLAGWLFVLSGGITIVAGLLSPEAGILSMVASVLATAFISIVYSYVVWRHDPARAAPTDFD